ncbi:peptidoglycan glycosyltransferase [Amycolatopsis marina]|uniref:Peptidoglycan glycosyltransferase n=1 Tax=Amycolatopsis marina TaxID=490629 RepID=A0A1I0W0S4_9PSEU|nr:penicillin-binding protein 2 [Amycolatopsis marina]SFA82038.1 peptidoglycan glycosyltransferase [Amycolatopsis marina]
MNTPLRKVGVAMLVMVTLLLVNATYIQVVKADDYRADSRNQRVLLDEYSRQRGQIVSAESGQILAGVKPSDDKYNFIRTYPNGPVYAPVTGYYSIRYGAYGLERVSDEILNGSDPRLFVRRLSDMITGRDLRGGNVRVTVLPKVQEAAYKAMVDNGYQGAVVALDPKTGDILGMVSTPSYDPSELASHDSEVQEEAWTKYTEDEANPILNQSISETYPPGSTFKLVVTAAALENGMTADSKVTKAAEVDLPGGVGDLENFGHQPCPGDTLADALAYSCNTAFAEIAADLGAEKLRAAAAKFGIGMTDLRVPLRVAPSALGDLPGDPELYQSGIGQRDVRLTPMQVALLSSTVANGGVPMKPNLVDSYIAADLSDIESFDPEELTGEAAMSQEHATILRDMMIASENNTKGGGKREGLEIASKTGTAEHGTAPKETPPHAWYTAFAPAKDPKVAVAVIVESGGNRGLAATGGSVAASIGRSTINAALGGG